MPGRVWQLIYSKQLSTGQHRYSVDASWSVPDAGAHVHCALPGGYDWGHVMCGLLSNYTCLFMMLQSSDPSVRSVVCVRKGWGQLVRFDWLTSVPWVPFNALTLLFLWQKRIEPVESLQLCVKVFYADLTQSGASVTRKLEVLVCIADVCRWCKKWEIVKHDASMKRDFLTTFADHKPTRILVKTSAHCCVTLLSWYSCYTN